MPTYRHDHSSSPTSGDLQKSKWRPVHRHYFGSPKRISIYVKFQPLNRFSRMIRQKNRFGPRRCLLGVKNFGKNFLTPKGGKNPLSHAFQWETKMPITFDPVDRSSRNLVYSIRAIGASMLYAHKPEIPKTKWPPTPSWIFRQI